MFSELIEIWEKGNAIDRSAPDQVASSPMVKKGGVMQQPRLSWSNDPKDSRHLLWAAILLKDRDDRQAQDESL